MTDSSKKPLVIISGPTASGKSSLGIRLAKDLNGEIISADSMQVYKHMNIGTAKVTRDEMQGVAHHMLDVCEPFDSFSIADYKNAAKTCLLDICSRGKVPIIVGGTGFYIHAVLYDNEFDESDDYSDRKIRNRLETELKEKGPEYLHNRLKEIDPDSAESIHYNNTKRVVRALEFYELTGYTISEHNRTQREKESPYNFLFIALNRDKDELYRLIDERVDVMVQNGLLDEINKLKSLGCTEGSVPMQGIGYKELFDYDNLEDAINSIKLNSRHYAKKQFTWLRKEKNVHWIDAPVSEDDYKWILQECSKKNIRPLE